MDDVARWLRSLGLDSYAGAFGAQHIGMDLLNALTDSDLKELGVSSLGHRKLLLQAIEARATSKGDSAGEITHVPAARVPDAERRQLSVMFCDLVDSTVLAGSLDPEDFRSILRTYHDAVVRKVAPFDGFIAQFLGDGVLVYFGYPRAHEDDAERAVQAALQVVQAVDALKLHIDVKLSTRVGIATGAVVVGEIGAGASTEPSATGDTPNLAARLQSIARAGQVVIAGSTHELVGEVFEAQDLGPQQLKGFGSRVSAWRVLRERVVSSRFERQHAHGLSDFIGRDRELLILLQRWAMASAGKGQVVVLSGEPGIGKSRICQAFRDRPSTEAVSTVVIQCTPHYQGSPLYPVMQHLERAAGLTAAGGDASDPEGAPNRLLRNVQAAQQSKLTVLNDLCKLRAPTRRSAAPRNTHRGHALGRLRNGRPGNATC
ncbi:AAA family ATPase [Variovorax paradoxus]|nr:AAA family ATPase [Variovorax paradoxus]